MNETRLSLLQRIAGGESVAWVEADAIYRPMIRRWLSRYRLQANDVEDLTQEVLAILVRQADSFEHNGRVGAFRNWLRTTTFNVATNSLRKRNIPLGTGASDFQLALGQLEDPNSDASKEFDAEHRRHIIAYLIGEIEGEFATQTIAIFRRHVVEGASVKETVQQLGVSDAAVHTAKSRVLRKLRIRATELLDDVNL